jgi:putative nucleotidyltransferase with HDIG domain
MPAPKLIRQLFCAAEVVLLAATVAAAVLLARPEEWHPAALVAVLLVLALVGEWFSVEMSDGVLSAATIALVLAMGLLGPAPAAACGLAAIMLSSARRRLRPAQWLNNVSAFASMSYGAGTIVRVLSDQLNLTHNHHAAQNGILALVLMAGFGVLLCVNFVLIGLDTLLEQGRPFRRQVTEFLPMLPGELAAGALATVLAIAYRSAGLSILIAAIVLLLIFQHLTVALLRSEARAEQLQARSRQLVGLQLGVLRTLVRALGMRDETTGRHAAAVAAYATALATELGCSEEERDTVRAAGLLHEIGKFTWPDRVLHAAAVEEQDLSIVRNHPQEGAILVGALDGYGPVADAILYHHERVDGLGYPAGLIGHEIPLASRILAVCSTYDTMTAQAGYRSAMTPEEGVEELRVAVRSGQLDADLVETFTALLEREGLTFAQDADFETELEFERRVREMAEPPSAAPTRRLLLSRGSRRAG